MQAIHITHPDWLPALLAHQPSTLTDPTAQMALVLTLAEETVRQHSGGPFAAAVFTRADGQLLGAAVNRVGPSHCSLAHAEMLALASAQQRLGDDDLGRACPGGCVLVSSAEPCAMCMGAIPWSGVEALCCGARDSDVRAIGFDEGDKPENWVAGYAQRGITVTRDLLRPRAIAVLEHYAASGGEHYGPGAST
ncbi:nucleoside deaminase [Marichromatium bheemlicum]|uniref:Nucleoside deaminase n=1 Tax=Marichromatium bheemlicum TaxID=365339 RepID=A0ABX1I4T1_9GAMM|nr:nucleoside deaminase [Marichromatium bheemlicum]NKN32009.1 nucleoside deaminase [Marichromatium bheemlicum]